MADEYAFEGLMPIAIMTGIGAVLILTGWILNKK